ncbi:MAG: maltose alpha-D-glucosyltransferase [Pirellulales bacterium]
MAAKRSSKQNTDVEPALDVDPLWYKDAVIYQLHVRSYFDSDRNGIGDFAGLTQKLDYVQDLGVTAVWLLPFYPSPLRDDGYDIADYTSVHPTYGDLRDFKNFVREAHARGLRVITELVINHTSDQHPWFQRARRAKPGSAERDFYVWSDTPEKYQEARIIFKDFESSNWSWDPLAKAYFWHRFYAHQPDLNFENPRVQRALFDVLDYWLRLGVDGLRLDAVPYLYEREGTNCENLPQTHAFLKKLRRHVDESFPGRMLLAEANQWPEDAIAYFGDGDECHTAFHFPVMPRLFMSIHMEDRFPIVDILQQTPAIPEQCQWLIFLRNHDELTLEMVTDEERDYMYRIYARDHQARINLGIRRRLAPLLGNNRRKIELMNGLLCALPGTPVIYYGDEIGMGDNIYLGDRHGVRTPMQWSPDRNAGFSDANPQRLYSPVIIDSEYLFETVNVETQQNNPTSLLWWMKRLIALRQHYVALRRGTIELLAPENSKILAFTRDYEQQSVLMIANLSRFTQYVELDLSRFAGRTPIEMFGQTRFPGVTKAPYFLTLAPHAFYWFALVQETAEAPALAASNLDLKALGATDGLRVARRSRVRKNFEAILARELPRLRWLVGPARRVQAAHVTDSIPLDKDSHEFPPRALIVRVDYLEGEGESYLVPLGTAFQHEAEALAASVRPPAIIAHVTHPQSGENGILYDATSDPKAMADLVELIANRRRIKGLAGELVGWAMPASTVIEALERETTTTTPSRGETNDYSCVTFGDKAVLKVFRRLETGVNPDLEMSRFLSGQADPCPHVLPLYGAIEYRPTDGEVQTAAVLQACPPNNVTGWQFAHDTLSRFFESVMTVPPETRAAMAIAPGVSLWERAGGDAPQQAKDLLGAALEWAGLLGRRLAELHTALAADHVTPAFTPEPYTQLYQRSIYQTWRKLTLQTMAHLRRQRKSLPANAQAAAEAVLAGEPQVLEAFRAIVGSSMSGLRIRCHGNLSLHHVLYTGKDFLFVDFEGRPNRPVAAGRMKRSPLVDLAALLHSMRGAATQAVQLLPTLATATPEAIASWHQAATFWHVWCGSALVRSYLTVPSAVALLPSVPEHAQRVLRFHQMAEAVDELETRLTEGSDQVGLALAGLLETLAAN